MAQSDPLKIVAFGDSITEGTYGGADVSQAWPFVLQMFLNKAGIPCEVLNMGIPGETTPEGLRRFKRQVVSQKPKLVLIMYGANDSFVPYGYNKPAVPIRQFEESLEEMIQQSLENKILPVMMTTTPLSLPAFFPEDAHTENGGNNFLEEYTDRVRLLAQLHNLHVIDHYRVWKEMDQTRQIIQKYLPDGVHPNVAGNLLMAETILNALNKIIQNEILNQ